MINGGDQVSYWPLSHIGYVKECLMVYIPQPFTSISTHSAKVWWGLWVFGLHEKLTSSELGMTYQAPYLLLHMENLFNNMDGDMGKTR